MNDVPPGFGEFDVAVVGMSGRFPGAESVDQLWNGLSQGRELIGPVVADRSGATTRLRLTNTPESPFGFDAAFFGVPPVEATLMDPQHRMFVECCYNALENACYAPGRLPGLVGIYASEYMNIYLLDRVLPYLQGSGQLNTLQAQIGNEKDHLSTWAAYKLGLSGPALSVQTSCSSSLVAVHLACDGLITFQCDMALAGGVTLSPWNMNEYESTEGGLTAADGHCRAFDQSATGTVYSNGVGVVVLKRLGDAMRDGDCIYAVIKASAVNNDAGNRIGYAAPSVQGQVEVIRRALAAGDLRPSQIGFVECHGTGTPLGDDIELEALHEVFEGSAVPRACALGAIKANLGHLGVASGVVGLIKVSLALRHRSLPPQINVDSPRGRLRQPSSPFFISCERLRLPDAGPLYAGLSSFGLGGTNVHMVLQSPPDRPGRRPAGPWDAPLIFPFSARSPLALRCLLERMDEAIQDLPDEALPHAAGTLQWRRDVFEVRHAIAARDAGELRRLLAAAPRAAASAGALAEKPALVFLFPAWDDGAERAKELLTERSAAFARRTERLRRSIQLRTEAGGGTRLDLFEFQAALAESLLEQGVLPSRMLGYGAGEVAALYTAGLLDLEECLSLIAALDRAGPGPEPSPAESAETLVRAWRLIADPRSCRGARASRIPVAIDGKLAAVVRGETAESSPQAPALADPPDTLNLLELADPASLLFELGAAGDFSALAARYRRQLAGLNFLAVAGEDSSLSLARAVATAWSAGAPVVWPESAADDRIHVPLPGYAFDRRRYELFRSGEVLRAQVSTTVADGDVEEILRDLWFDYFGAEQPAAEDNFFEYGADSLSVATLARVLSRLFKISIAMADLYAAPAFEDQVRLVRDGLDAAEAIERSASPS